MRWSNLSWNQKTAWHTLSTPRKMHLKTCEKNLPLVRTVPSTAGSKSGGGGGPGWAIFGGGQVSLTSSWPPSPYLHHEPNPNLGGQMIWRYQLVPTPQTPFATAPIPSKHISPSANTSNPLFNCPHALKTYFTQCQHPKPPLQLPPCPQNTFRTVPTPQTSFSTAHMPSKHISPSAKTSNPLCNCPYALKTHYTQCQHLKPPFQLPPCPQNTFHPLQTPQTPFTTAPMLSKHISPIANTSNPFATARCPQNTIHPVPTPQTPFPTFVCFNHCENAFETVALPHNPFSTTPPMSSNGIEWTFSLSYFANLLKRVHPLLDSEFMHILAKGA